MFETPDTAQGGQNVYEPCEDSFLFLDCLEAQSTNKTLNGSIVLEIGSGSGIVSTFCAKLLPEAVFYATDVNPDAVDATINTWDLNMGNNPPKNTTSLDALRASLCPLRPGVVDLLLFNPPYVPSESVPALPTSRDDDQWIYLALDGGEDGMQVTWQLLDQLDDILSPNGAAYILFCARNKPQQVKQVMEGRGWAVEECIKRKAGWEMLSILKFTR